MHGNLHVCLLVQSGGDICSDVIDQQSDQVDWSQQWGQVDWSQQWGQQQTAAGKTIHNY